MDSVMTTIAVLNHDVLANHGMWVAYLWRYVRLRNLDFMAAFDYPVVWSNFAEMQYTRSMQKLSTIHIYSVPFQFSITVK